MQLREKIEATLVRAEQLLERAAAPAALMSFGKDSMVMWHLLRHLQLPAVFCVPAIATPEQWLHVHRIAANWKLQVHRAYPTGTALQARDGELAMRTLYQVGPDFRLGWTQRILPSRKRCVIRDVLERPSLPATSLPFDVLVCGQKDGDPDFLGGKAAVPHDGAAAGGMRWIFPLRDWTDADVWDYVERFELPVDEARYDVAGRQEWARTEASNDRLEVCTACIDRRNSGRQVPCPKSSDQLIPFNAERAASAYGA